VGVLGLSVSVTFTFKLFLIISPNVISILIGWDGLDLVSYLLIIYYQNVKSYGAGVLIVLCNRIGDVVLLMVIAWIINVGGWSFIYYLEFGAFFGRLEVGYMAIRVFDSGWIEYFGGQVLY
jgi:NADH:ubiquinone oxidoreductase subunit 5 (subunit L)/multisubunit Na+/H+ antiporter MnhA subunit